MKWNMPENILYTSNSLSVTLNFFKVGIDWYIGLIFNILFGYIFIGWYKSLVDSISAF